MHSRFDTITRVIISVTASTLLFGPHVTAQTRPAAPARASAQAPAAAPAQTERDVAATQAQLIKLLKLSPKLTTVVARDPSLLANQEYVSSNNPQLAEFLESHPEVARNPEFYLFDHLPHENGESDEVLVRETWPEYFRPQRERTGFDEFVTDLPPVIALAFFLVALAWILRLFIENRRWNRIFTLQSEVHGRLIDKFGNNQELAQYMETDAGKRFLEAAPIPVNFGPDQRVPNAIARVLTPLQVGVVLVLLGIGFLILRNGSNDHDAQIMRVLGTVILMPGIGFIISAGITWVVAARLGLMPPRLEPPYGAPPANRLDGPSGSTER